MFNFRWAYSIASVPTYLYCSSLRLNFKHGFRAVGHDGTARQDKRESKLAIAWYKPEDSFNTANRPS